MKATGIIRRIDDLGRVVIPKEIRKTYNIYEGDPLEIYTSNNAVCFKKYQPEQGYKESLQNIFVELLNDSDLEHSKRKIVSEKLKEVVDLLDDDDSE